MKKRIIQVITVLLTVWIVANIDFDIWAGLICGPLLIWIVICVLCGKFKVTTGGSNHLTPKTSDYESPTPKTGGAHPISWQQGKVWVPGTGYRDAQGNYYDYKGIPTVTPVDTRGK